MIQRLRDRKGEQGFTLVELLVVIVILGILASIVVFAVNGITEKGTDSANKSDIRVLEAAEETYYAKSTAAVPTYATEQQLVNDNLLRALSTRMDICLNGATPTDYQIVAQGAACPSGWNK